MMVPDRFYEKFDGVDPEMRHRDPENGRRDDDAGRAGNGRKHRLECRPHTADAGRAGAATMTPSWSTFPTTVPIRIAGTAA